MELIIWLIIIGALVSSIAFDGGLSFVTGLASVCGTIFFFVFMATFSFVDGDDGIMFALEKTLEILGVILKWLVLHKGGIINELIWTWAILGSVFLIIEVFRRTLVFGSLGLSAAALAGLLIFVPFNIGFQFLFFIVGSVIAMSTLHIDYRNKLNFSKINKHEGETGEKLGQITEIWGDGKFTVKFDMKVMGSQTWMALSKEPLEIGDLVKVTSIHENNLRVIKVETN